MIAGAELEPWAQTAALALEGYDLGPVEISLLSLRQNAVFLVTSADGHKQVLRLCRPGYRTIEQVQSEIAWVDALHVDSVVSVPATVPTSTGAAVHLFHNGTTMQAAVLSEFVSGSLPDPGDADRFRTLGRLSALLHRQAETWDRPFGWTRPIWNLETTIGEHSAWGNWRHSTHLMPETTELFEVAERDVRNRLAGPGSAELTTGLVHGDLHGGNILLVEDELYLLDFDDCGTSWPLWELACSIIDGTSDPVSAPEWLAGYLEVRGLSAADIGTAAPLIMVRILLIVGWLQTHQHTTTDEENEAMFRILVAQTHRYLADGFSL